MLVIIIIISGCNQTEDSAPEVSELTFIKLDMGIPYFNNFLINEFSIPNLDIKKQVYKGGAGAAGISIYDLEEDGNLELIILDLESIKILDLNGKLLETIDSTNVKTIDQVYNGGAGAAGIAVYDLEKDGNPELIILDLEGIKILDLNGDLIQTVDSTNVNTKDQVSQEGAGAAGITVYDLEEDGNPELIILDLEGIKILNLNGDLLQTIDSTSVDTKDLVYKGGAGAAGIAVYDLEKDKNPELIILDMEGIKILDFNGNLLQTIDINNIKTSNQIYEGGAGAAGIELGFLELGDDKDLDILIIDTNGIKIFYNQFCEENQDLCITDQKGEEEGIVE